MDSGKVFEWVLVIIMRLGEGYLQKKRKSQVWNALLFSISALFQFIKQLVLINSYSIQHISYQCNDQY